MDEFYEEADDPGNAELIDHPGVALPGVPRNNFALSAECDCGKIIYRTENINSITLRVAITQAVGHVLAYHEPHAVQILNSNDESLMEISREMMGTLTSQLSTQPN